MAAATFCDVAALFNSQPHIDGIKEGLVCTEEHKSNQFTFMLKHKHFDLLPGEVLYVEKVQTGYNVSVKESNQLDNSSAPCMWMYDFGWKPFAYTSAEFGYTRVPEIREGSYNLGIRWLNNGGIEHTDELKRMQWVRPDLVEGIPVTTLVNFLEKSGCVTRCELTKCQELKVGKGHRCSHVCPHYKEEGGKINEAQQKPASADTI